MLETLKSGFMIVAGIIAIVTAVVALVKWIRGTGATEVTVQQAISSGFVRIESTVASMAERFTASIAALSARMDRAEARAELEAKERATREAVDAERRRVEAIEDTRSAERARAMEGILSEHAELHEKAQGLFSKHHDRLRDLERKLSDPRMRAVEEK